MVAAGSTSKPYEDVHGGGLGMTGSRNLYKSPGGNRQEREQPRKCTRRKAHTRKRRCIYVPFSLLGNTSFVVAQDISDAKSERPQTFHTFMCLMPRCAVTPAAASGSSMPPRAPAWQGLTRAAAAHPPRGRPSGYRSPESLCAGPGGTFFGTLRGAFFNLSTRH